MILHLKYKCNIFVFYVSKMKSLKRFGHEKCITSQKIDISIYNHLLIFSHFWKKCFFLTIIMR